MEKSGDFMLLGHTLPTQPHGQKRQKGRGGDVLAGQSTRRREEREDPGEKATMEGPGDVDMEEQLEGNRRTTRGQIKP